ncbi:MAG: IS110 family transposase [Candidatus Marinimicrobia bacterium]|nr:IS110 family transposase [Candidatus Neomarinimicrobiota bacterium]
MDKGNIKDWTGQTLFIGIDLHRKKWSVTIRSKHCEHKSFVAPPEKEKLVKTLKAHFPGAQFKAVYEAGCFGYGLANYLNGIGISTIIVSPQNIPIKPGSCVKTDKNDSRRLARELARGDLVAIRIPESEEVYHRSILRKRAQFMKRKVIIQNQIKSDLMFYGIRLSDNRNRYWSKDFIMWLRSPPFEDKYYHKAFNFMLDEYEEIKSSIYRLDRIIVELSRLERYQAKVKLLRTVPGIGLLSAMTIILEVGDINRFPSYYKFISYIGLSPSEHSSGEQIRRGSLTHMGNRILRNIFVEASWQAIRRDPFLLDKFNRVSHGKAKTKAIISIANSLARRVRRILLYEEPYVIGIC